MAYINHRQPSIGIASGRLSAIAAGMGGVSPQWEYDTTICRLEAPNLVAETLGRDLKDALHEAAIGRAEAVPTHGPGDRGETMGLRYRLPCPRTCDQAFAAIAAIRWFGNRPVRVRLMEAYEARAGIA